MHRFMHKNKAIWMSLGLMLGMLLPWISTGCADKAQIPAFLRIDTILVDSTSYDSVGSTSSKIRFAWVYADDNLQGVYQLPCRVPILKSGSTNLKIFAGVNENGVGELALQYPFYAFYESTVTFIPGDTLTVIPHVRYKQGLKAPYMEDFDFDFSPTISKDNGGGFFDYLMDPTRAFEGSGCGYFYLPEGEQALICTTNVITTPKNKAAYTIEFNYKNNCDFLIGIRISQDGETILGLRASDTWNKIYINVTPTVDAIPGTDLKLFFIIPQDTLIPIQEVYIDNLKFLF